MYPDSDSTSAKLFQRARNVIADGVSRTTIRVSPYPLYVERGAGSRVFDVDSNELIDFNNNYTSLIHGHALPEINAAVQAQLANGTAFCFGTEAEIELAELLCGRVAGFDRIRFCNSGTEAVMNVIKAARAYTGRPKIAKCEGAYHGSYDHAEVSLGVGPDAWGAEDAPAAVAYSRGSPAGVLNDVVVIPFNDTPGAERILREHAGELAGILIDPVSSQVGMLGADRDFVEMLRRVADDIGALLMFDEVIAFRLGIDGAQGGMTVTPDISALGKIIGGGFPVGAMAGRAEVMSVFESKGGRAPLPQGGTFNANPITMVAGLAAMKLMDQAAFDDLNRKGETVRQQMREAFTLANAEGQVTGQGSLFRIYPHSRSMRTYRDAWMRPEEQARMNDLFAALVNRGVYMSPYGMGCLSTAMTDEDLARLPEALLDALRETRMVA
jgi:glutamate-1-semialdehyde 2,1-aminomutase